MFNYITFFPVNAKKYDFLNAKYYIRITNRDFIRVIFHLFNFETRNTRILLKIKAPVKAPLLHNVLRIRNPKNPYLGFIRARQCHEIEARYRTRRMPKSGSCRLFLPEECLRTHNRQRFAKQGFDCFQFALTVSSQESPP